MMKFFHILVVHSEISLKRKRVKTSGQKGSYKVCSKKRLCNEKSFQSERERVEMVEQVVRSGKEYLYSAVKLVPYSRHVDCRRVEPPPFSISMRYNYMDYYKIEPKYKAIMKDNDDHLQRYRSTFN
jgi:hypothetical protein